MLNSPEQRWFVKVADKEYGPADLDELREWKGEGRLIASNPVRVEHSATWTTAGAISGLFEEPAPVRAEPKNVVFQVRSFREVIRETFYIYRKGFLHFFLFSLVVAVPSFLFQQSLPPLQVFRESATTPSVGAFPILMFLLLLVAWPVFLAGIQRKTLEIAEERRHSTADALRDALRFWPRFAKLSIFVYGSYFFWTALPFLAMMSLLQSGRQASSLGTVLLIFLLAAGLGAIIIFMTARLWINFLFWQQSAAISGLQGVEALRESRELSRTGPELPWMERPLWRGVILSALWLLIVVALSVATSIPVILYHLRGVTSPEEALVALQRIANQPVRDTVTIALNVGAALLHAAIRPLLGIAFVVLFFDAKARSN